MPRRKKSDLERLCDQVLGDTTPAGLEASVRDALAKGATPAEVVRRAKAAAGGRTTLTVLQVEALLERIQAEGDAGRN